jgi:hypothetical protein
MDDEGPEPEEGGSLVVDDGHGRGKGQRLQPQRRDRRRKWLIPHARDVQQQLRARAHPALRPAGLAPPKAANGARKATSPPSTSTERRIKQRRRRRSRGGCDDRHLLAELDVDISEGAEHGCGGVKHAGHGLLEGLGACWAGDTLRVWWMVVVMPVVVVVVRGGGRCLRCLARRWRMRKSDWRERHRVSR